MLQSKHMETVPLTATVETPPPGAAKADKEPDPEKLQSLLESGEISSEIAEFVTSIEDRTGEGEPNLTVVHLNTEASSQYFEKMTSGYSFALHTVAGIFRRANATGVTMGSAAFALDTMSNAVMADDIDPNFSIDHLPQVLAEINQLQEQNIVDLVEQKELNNGLTVKLRLWITDEETGERTEVEMFAQQSSEIQPGEAAGADNTIEGDTDYLAIGKEHHTVYALEVPSRDGQGSETIYFYGRASLIELYTKTLAVEFAKYDFNTFQRSDGDLKQKVAARLIKLQRMGVNSLEQIRDLSQKYLPPSLDPLEDRQAKVDAFINKFEEIHQKFETHRTVLGSMTEQDADSPHLVDKVMTPEEIQDHPRPEDLQEATLSKFEKINQADLHEIMHRYEQITTSADFLYTEGFVERVESEDKVRYLYHKPQAGSLETEHVSKLQNQAAEVISLADQMLTAQEEDFTRYEELRRSLTEEEDFPAYLLVETTLNDFLPRVRTVLRFYKKKSVELLQDLATIQPMEALIDPPPQGDVDGMEEALTEEVKEGETQTETPTDTPAPAEQPSE